ncbi:MAG: DUF4368 domain-containing protein [Firmicutes bacterium]|nr:DUF4368 domain-containing protein [Bacillota bacterium]
MNNLKKAINTLKTIVRVVLYLRLSDEDRNKLTKKQLSESIKNQELMLREYVSEHENWQVVAVYNDEDWSGGDSSRPNFNKMINECEAGQVDIVLCKTQARFARDSELIEKYIHNKFHEWNVRFITAVDKIDNTKIETKKTSQILGLADEWYLEDTSTNIRDTLRSKRKDGQCTASFIKYGYKKDPENKNHLIIDPVAAEVVKRIFDRYIQGNGLEKIANDLNKDKIPSPLEYKKMNGSKYQNPLLKNYLDYDCIVNSGTYIVGVNFVNNESEILKNVVLFHSLSTDMKSFNNKCDVILKRFSQNKTKIYYSEKENLNVNNFNITDFIELTEEMEIPKTATCIMSLTEQLDRTHMIDYQFEVTLNENVKKEKYYFTTTQYINNTDNDLNIMTNIRKKMKWSSQTVKSILQDEIYIGNMVQFKSTTISYKNHKVIYNDDEDRIRKNNTHEAIVDKVMWYTTQERFKETARSNQNGEFHAFANKVFCLGCNRVFCKCGKRQESGYGYLCCKDRREKWSNCDNKKYLKEEELHDFVLNKINDLIKRFYDKNEIEELNNEEIEKDLFKDKIRILETEMNNVNKELQNKSSFFQKLYEDRTSGILPEKEFMILMNKYKDDNEKLEERIKIIRKEIAIVNEKKQTLKSKKTIFKKYSTINKLTIEIVEDFIDKVYIGHYDNKTCSREIKIIWNFEI